jgi:hypothetical protein
VVTTLKDTHTSQCRCKYALHVLSRKMTCLLPHGGRSVLDECIIRHIVYLSNLAMKCQLTSPNRVTSSRLLKSPSCVEQIWDLSDTQLKDLLWCLAIYGVPCIAKHCPVLLICTICSVFSGFLRWSYRLTHCGHICCLLLLLFTSVHIECPYYC